MAGYGMEDEESEDSGGESERGGSDRFGRLMREAFPAEDWTDERLAAFKDALYECLGDGEPDGDEGGHHGGGADLALIFGPKKKR